jgi:hypothetical protein
MTNSNDRLDRLDRIEALLATVAESNAASIQRLDRVESVLAITAERLTRAEQVAESNARAIEAWSGRIDESGTRLETAIADTVAMIADLGQQQQETDQQVAQDKAEANQRFEVFLSEARADRAEMRAAREQWEMQVQANTAEHRAFTQNIQVLLAEIARLWQRVAG